LRISRTLLRQGIKPLLLVVGIAVVGGCERFNYPGTMAAKEAAMIELTEEQAKQLHGPELAYARDPQTNEIYVLLRASLYERLRSLLNNGMADVSALVNEVMAEDDALDPNLGSYQKLLGDDRHVNEAYPAINATFAAGWTDPKMDDYDRYEDLKPPPNQSAKS
jgi:hypothetical protein